MTKTTLAPLPLASLIAFQEKASAFEPVYTDERGNEHTLRYLDEAGEIDKDSRFYVASHECGPYALVHVSGYYGDGFDAAWEAFVDDLPAVEASELPEAYEDADGNTFDELARTAMNTKLTREGACPPYWEREAWDAHHAEQSALASELLRNYGNDENGDHDGETYPEIVEGYEEDSSGVVKSVGHYSRLDAVDPSTIHFAPKEEVVA